MSDHWVITAPTGGTRRAGRYWPQGASIVPATDIDDQALAAIEADPRMDLVWVGVEADPTPKPVPDAAITEAVSHLIADLADLIKTLPADAYTKGGVPDLRALTTNAGRRVTVAERNAAWARLQAAGFTAPVAQ